MTCGATRWSNIDDGPVIAPLVISMGDPAGIGPEIIARSWDERHRRTLPPFVAVGDARAIARVWPGPIERVDDLASVGAAFARALPVISVEGHGTIVPGQPDADGGRCALQSLELAFGLVRTGGARALVTGPVSKVQLYDIGFTHPGQTEFVAERCGIARENAVMMLAGPGLRVVPMTTHVALADVPRLLSVEMIVAKARVAARGMTRNFGINAPRLAFAGLNPHAGESGTIGREEIDVIAPAIAILRDEGIDATGPFAADTMFHERARAGYDVAMCCYHDQALVPIKTLYFDDGVNMTLGLPIVRTSPRSRHRLCAGRARRGAPRRDDRGDRDGRCRRRAAAHRLYGRVNATSGPHPGTPDLPPLREVIARYGLSASRALGQNFLFDAQLLDRIARIPGDLADRGVLEIGPGPGGLTRALLARGARVVAIERDRRCIPALAELAEAYPGRLTVIEGDALAIDARAHFDAAPHIVANLPYNVGTALLIGWLSDAWPPWWQSLTLMFQREVADRIVARAGGAAYGRLAVLAQWRAEARIALPVHRSAFTPPPKVMSAVVHLTPAVMPAGVALPVLERLTAAAFGQRRKMLRQSLRGVEGALAGAGG